jgi:MYXO-CTERM domain-containing protein
MTNPRANGDRCVGAAVGIFLTSLLLLLATARTAGATSVTIAAGQTYTLSADLVLSGADALDAKGTVQSPCVVAGNGHAIVANNLTGHVKIENCVLQRLGGTQETTPALGLTAQGTADITITGSTFDACGSIRLHLQDTATATFDNNLLKDTGIAYIQDELVGSMYVPAFYADGNSTGAKVFQGNRIYRDAAHFDGVTDWLIGGYGDTFSNVIIGHRGVIRVRGNHVKVVGNFINPQYALTSPDVENIVVGSDDANPDLVMEHNVLRSGEWVLRECQGEVRYNLIADMNGHAWIKGPHDCNVHHNVFVNYDTPDPNREAGIDAVYFTPHLNIYNNTLDGGGKVANLGVPAIHAGQGRLIERVSSNAITNFVIPSGYAAVSSTDDETQYDTNPPPGDARMHFADYNLFYNPDAPSQVDYSIKVEPDDVTPITKGSAGFAMHDVHAAPAFAGPLPTAFPFASADVQAGTVKVSTILAHYRQLYTPASGSPLIGAGDPTNAAHNNIGAIGQGPSLDPGDQFGTFMPGNDGGPPPLNLPDAGAIGRGPDGGSGSADSGALLADAGTSADAGASSDASASGDANTSGEAGSSGDAGPLTGGHGASGCGCRLASASHRTRAGVVLLFMVAAAGMRLRRRSSH